MANANVCNVVCSSLEELERLQGLIHTLFPYMCKFKAMDTVCYVVFYIDWNVAFGIVSVFVLIIKVNSFFFSFCLKKT